MAFNTNYHDTGLFGVYVVTDRDSSNDLAFVTMNEVVKMCYEVGEADVARARNRLKASMIFFQVRHAATFLDLDTSRTASLSVCWMLLDFYVIVQR